MHTKLKRTARTDVIHEKKSNIFPASSTQMGKQIEQPKYISLLLVLM